MKRSTPFMIKKNFNNIRTNGNFVHLMSGVYQVSFLTASHQS